jgi:hypothetical protein
MAAISFNTTRELNDFLLLLPSETEKIIINSKIWYLYIREQY